MRQDLIKASSRRRGHFFALALGIGWAVASPLGMRAQDAAEHNAPPALTLPDAPSSTLAELQSPTDPSSSSTPSQANPNSSTPAQQDPSAPADQKKQPSRILWVIPNYRAVSSNVAVPPLTPGGKFKLMIDDSFDYSAFLYVGFVAGLRMAAASYPEFGVGAAGYGRYYWHAFADNVSGNAFTEFLLPVAFKQDPRYFTKGHGGFWNRTGYAASRLVVTRSDKGTSQFNISEIGGNLAAAGISEAYYPANKRGVSNTLVNWAVQVGLDGAFDVVKEFWPDIAHKVLHQD
ncbi:MAG TPA: hypothetical protein VE779_09395 [Candidatus Angelobacter sp.]|jgi:hypothetical protein|nr:hypothetical protein [Candidatus Angelobacter sp.]